MSKPCDAETIHCADEYRLQGYAQPQHPRRNVSARPTMQRDLKVCWKDNNQQEDQSPGGHRTKAGNENTDAAADFSKPAQRNQCRMPGKIAWHHCPIRCWIHKMVRSGKDEERANQPGRNWRTDISGPHIDGIYTVRIAAPYCASTVSRVAKVRLSQMHWATRALSKGSPWIGGSPMDWTACTGVKAKGWIPSSHNLISNPDGRRSFAFATFRPSSQIETELANTSLAGSEIAALATALRIEGSSIHQSSACESKRILMLFGGVRALPRLSTMSLPGGKVGRLSWPRSILDLAPNSPGPARFGPQESLLSSQRRQVGRGPAWRPACPLLK